MAAEVKYAMISLKSPTQLNIWAKSLQDLIPLDFLLRTLAQWTYWMFKNGQKALSFFAGYFGHNIEDLIINFIVKLKEWLWEILLPLAQQIYVSPTSIATISSEKKKNLHVQYSKYMIHRYLYYC